MWVLILWFSGLMSEANFKNEKRNNRIGFQIKSWKRQFETGLKKNRMMKADKNFCITNAVELKSRKYFSLKCATGAEKYTFFGFTDGKLGKRKLYNINYATIINNLSSLIKVYNFFFIVEVIECRFYIFDKKWSFDEILEIDDDDKILERRKFELFTFDHQFRDYKLR